MKLEYRIILLSLLLCLLAWVAGAFLEHFLFHEGTLWGMLAFDVSVHEAFLRSAGIATVLLFGGLSTIILARLKRSNERNKHQNRVLRGIRNVNQLIAKEGNKGKLIQGACDMLVEDRGFGIAWILLTDPLEGFACSAAPGHDEQVSALTRLMRQEGNPLCVKHLQESTEAFVVYEDPSKHIGCPLVSTYGVSASFVCRLEFGDTTYGFMGVSVPKAMAYDWEELGLFLEVAEDIAYALHNLDVEAERMTEEGGG